MATRPIPSNAPVRTISLAEATAQLGTVVEAVATGDGEVILERDGTPKAAVISMEEYRHLLAVRDQERKADALRRLEAVMASQRELNADLTPEQAMELAQRLSREIREERYLEAQALLGHERATGDSPE